MKKRLLAIFLCLVMALTLLPGTALATVGDTFSATNEGVEISYLILSEPDGSTPGAVQAGTVPPSATSYGTNQRAVDATTTSVTIPASVQHESKTYTVVSVGIYAFIYCDKLASVTLPNTVAAIGVSAFQGCLALESIVLPDTVTAIGDGAFRRCISLASVNLPDTVTTIGDGAFSNCPALKSVDLPESLESIGESGFYSSGLTSVALPAAVASIDDNAFGSCKYLTEITVDPANVDYTAEDGVLYDKTKTTLLTYPQGKSDASFIVPDGVTTIAEGAFRACKNLTSIILPAGLTEIGESAFSFCDGLTSMSFPAELRTLRPYAFVDCNSLSSLIFAGNTAPDCEYRTFGGVSKTGTLYYPVDATGYDAGFGSYKDNVEPDDEVYPLKDWSRIPVYAVTLSPTGLTIEGLPYTPADNSAGYVATLTPAAGYQLPAAIIVTVGGVELTPGTDYTYNSATGELRILAANIGGEIGITAVGEAIPQPSGGGTLSYRLSFDTNGGDKLAGISGARGKVIDLDKYTPEREGYVFAGWYADEDLTQAIDEIKLTKNATVYAKWREIARVNPFIDVKQGDWFYDDVLTAYEDGLINGRSANTFVPEGSITIAEAIKLAACMNQLNNTGSVALANGSPLWYSAYVDYAIVGGIIAAGQFEDYEAIATRAQFAAIFAKALPVAEYGQINEVKDGDIPDVALADSNGAAVYQLYRAGVLKGNDALLTFAPGSDIKRSEVAAIVTRMMHPEKRVEIK